ncbi:SAV_915 family protein [Saccharopolyspora gloriosae]|uniref:SAV_915 family protein n=1 Tax=Saccharopolyspora gloriosae TaxID=455344 RepID=UPI001FB81244|nr:SAV_915 family protein [Saccharopolyspora gloriosae]
MVYGDADILRDHGNVAPAVLGAENLPPPDAEDQPPQQVFLPAERIKDRNQPVTLELRALTDGTTAMLAFTSLEALVAGCGPAQPWIAVDGSSIPDLQQRCAADQVVWDAAVPASQQRGEGAR